MDLAPGHVFSELAEHFVGFVDVLTDLRYESETDELDLLRLYETWALTGSLRAARRLRDEGIEPDATLRQRNKPH
jgi:hypothetical protein